MPLARRDRCPSAFTLIELLTVITVIGLLAAISFGGIKSAKTRASLARARSDLAALAGALEDYKRYYGDYPQLGGFNQAALTPTSPTAGPATGSVQARLFNCLTGVFGPKSFNPTDRINGPNFLPTQFLEQPKYLNGTLTNTFLVPSISPPNPPFKQEQNVGILDPWGHYILYYYKSANNAALWQAPGYVLYSVGPDGAHIPPPITGISTAAQLATATNADNIYAIP